MAALDLPSQGSERQPNQVDSAINNEHAAAPIPFPPPAQENDSEAIQSGSQPQSTAATATAQPLGGQQATPPTPFPSFLTAFFSSLLTDLRNTLTTRVQ